MSTRHTEPVSYTHLDVYKRQDEISTAQRLKGQSKAPDVFDLGSAVAMANTGMFAPYQVATWKDIPDNAKDPKGVWVYDYAGYMSVGYDSAKVPAPTALADLLKACLLYTSRCV